MMVYFLKIVLFPGRFLRNAPTCHRLMTRLLRRAKPQPGIRKLKYPDPALPGSPEIVRNCSAMSFRFQVRN